MDLCVVDACIVCARNAKEYWDARGCLLFQCAHWMPMQSGAYAMIDACNRWVLAMWTLMLVLKSLRMLTKHLKCSYLTCKTPPSGIVVALFFTEGLEFVYWSFNAKL